MYIQSKVFCKFRQSMTCIFLLFAIGLILISGCTRTPGADLILKNGRVYSLTWSDPAPDGSPATDAPFKDGDWMPEAEAVAVQGDRIIFVGSNEEIETYRTENTRVIDVKGGTI
ncbi:MAG: hypothetical protein ACE5HI_05520, partial [bacterium]